ncbi:MULTISPECIES: helix-turn-helix domain-containing protein [Burkholderia]|uniref:helix-turn-helix domain-containing protein n=1 Tax=unclassified Burkholderia TaxID=2613784 RepID=UPI000D763350
MNRPGRGAPNCYSPSTLSFSADTTPDFKLLTSAPNSSWCVTVTKTKTDGRKLDQGTQAYLRKTVVEAVRDGMTQTAAAKTYKVIVRAVSKWMKTAREGGLRALRAGKRGRRAESGR